MRAKGVVAVELPLNGMDHALLVTHSLTSAAFFWAVVLATRASHGMGAATPDAAPSRLPRARGFYRRLGVASLVTAALLYLGMRVYLGALPDASSANTALSALGMLASQTLILASLTLVLLTALARRRAAGAISAPSPAAAVLQRNGLRAFTAAAYVSVALFAAALVATAVSDGDTWALLPVRLAFTLALLVGGAWLLRAHGRALAQSGSTG